MPPVIVKFRCSKPWFQVPIANCSLLPVDLKLESSMRFFHRFHWFEITFGREIPTGRTTVRTGFEGVRSPAPAGNLDLVSLTSYQNFENFRIGSLWFMWRQQIFIFSKLIEKNRKANSSKRRWAELKFLGLRRGVAKMMFKYGSGGGGGVPFLLLPETRVHVD